MKTSIYNSFLTTLSHSGITTNIKLKAVSEKEVSYFIVERDRYGIIATEEIDSFILDKKDFSFSYQITNALSKLVSRIGSCGASPLYFFSQISYPLDSKVDSLNQIFSAVEQVATINNGEIIGGMLCPSADKKAQASFGIYGETAYRELIVNKKIKPGATIYLSGKIGITHFTKSLLNTNSAISHETYEQYAANTANLELFEFITSNYHPDYLISTTSPISSLFKQVNRDSLGSSIEFEKIPFIDAITSVDDKLKALNQTIICGSDSNYIFISNKSIEATTINNIVITPIGVITEETITTFSINSLAVQMTDNGINYSE